MFSALTEQSPYAVIVTDIKGTIEYVNPQFTQLTGYTLQEVAGLNPRILKSGMTPSEVYRDLWETITAGKKWEGIICNKKKDGSFYWEKEIVSPLMNEEGMITRFFAVKEDITVQKQKVRFEEGISHISYKLKERILYMAYHDSLTGLPNRNLFYDRMEMAILYAKRSKKMAAVMALDLDGFKPVNDLFGHYTGDLLLKEASGRMKECVRECDTVARFGGDEFMILLTNINHRDDANHVAEKLLGTLSLPFLIDNNKINITASAGISIYPANGNNTEELIKKADNALYRSKKEGKNTYRF